MKLQRGFFIIAFAVVLTGAVLLLGTACSIYKDILAETIHKDTHINDSHEDTLAAGKQLFLEEGCAVCHDSNAQGTPGYPAVAGFPQGHTKEQVRYPHHLMPRFTPEQVSDDEIVYRSDIIQGVWC